MSRTHPPDSGRRAQPAAAQKIDTPVLIVTALTAFFATLFATLLLLRPEPGAPTPALPADAPSEPTPIVGDTPRVDAPPPGPIPSAKPRRARRPSSELRARLEELGIQCAEGVDCYPE